MKNNYPFFWILLISFAGFFSSCKEKEISPASDPFEGLVWEQVEQETRSSTVHMMMWQGDPLINAYMKDYVAPTLLDRYGITLQVSSGQGKDIVNHALSEIEAGQKKGAIDMVWINGETFFQLKQIQALKGKFTKLLPNSKYIDWDNPFIKYDFQQEIDGMECPWGNVQLSFIYDQNRTPTPPASFEALEDFIRQNPGKVTIPSEFTGMTILKSWLIALAGQGTLDGAFDEEKYKKYSAVLWTKLRELKPFLWKEGQSVPNNLAQVHQLFSAGELVLTYSNNDAEVENKVKQGIFPASARSFVPDPGTIQNSHYLSILQNAPNYKAALVVINFLISPEAQLEKAKADVWGDGTVLKTSLLPEEMRSKFDALANREYALNRASIQSKAFAELAPEYMIRLYEDYRTQFLEQ